MSVFVTRHNEDGAIYVEAALVMPLLLLVTFVSAFFFMCAARYFSLQMLANEMAKDLSIALHTPGNDGLSLTQQTCIASCKEEISNYPWSDQQQGANQTFNVNLDTYVTYMYTNGGCWNQCAQGRYLLSTIGSGRTSYLAVRAQVYPVANWYDDELTNTPNLASPGDYFMVTVSYPLRAVWGGGIAFFGLAPNTQMVGTAVGVLERRV
jgi:hypothetical protein